MESAIRMTLEGWGNFYLITGTAAATLTGLQFVVQSLIASDAYGALGSNDPGEGVAAFGSPTVVHFTLALLVSAVLSVPWGRPADLGWTVGIIGAAALGYAAVIFRRARRQRSYVPVAEDWIWHVALPAIAYLTLLVAAGFIRDRAEAPLLAVGAATLLLLCIGIHNAWDTVTFLTVNIVRKVVSPEPTAATAAQSDPSSEQP